MYYICNRYKYKKILNINDRTFRNNIIKIYFNFFKNIKLYNNNLFNILSNDLLIKE